MPPLFDESEATSITSFVKIQKETAEERKMSAYLIVLQGTNVGAMYKVDGPETVVGRATASSIRLQDDGVSRRHARILQVDGQVLIEDLQSANGTIVNGAPVARTPLKDGDKIQIGSTTILKFTYHDNLDESFQKRMLEAAIRDDLTKAYNKKYFLERIDSEFAFAKRHKTPLALLMFDIDFFKKVNDNFGHLAGDSALASVSKLGQTVIRTEDLFARYGGEEFAILCRGINSIQGGILGERLRSAIEATRFEWQTGALPITVSVGVASLPEYAAESQLELIAGADEALYESKRMGRNRVTIKQAK